MIFLVFESVLQAFTEFEMFQKVWVTVYFGSEVHVCTRF